VELSCNKSIKILRTLSGTKWGPIQVRLWAYIMVSSAQNLTTGQSCMSKQLQQQKQIWTQFKQGHKSVPRLSKINLKWSFSNGESVDGPYSKEKILQQQSTS
jgi:hypothetical protein